MAEGGGQPCYHFHGSEMAESGDGQSHSHFHRSEMAEDGDGQSHYHFHDEVHIYNTGNADADQLGKQLRNIATGQGTDPITLNIQSRGKQDGIRDFHRSEMAEDGDGQSHYHFHDEVHIYNTGNADADQLGKQLQNIAASQGSDPNVLNIRSRGQQDGIRELLPLSAEGVDTFAKEEVQNARVGQAICGEQFRSSSDGIKIFQMQIFKWKRNDVQWLCCGIKDCTRQGSQTNTLIYFISSVDGIKNKLCYSVFLHAGGETHFGYPLCRVDDLPRLFTLKSSVRAAHISVPRIITNHRAFNFTRVSRPQGQSKACKFKVNWTLDNLGPRENFTRGECIFSKPFGDVQEEIVIVLKVYPNSLVDNPTGKWSVHISVLHLPQRARESGLEMNYKISANGSQNERTKAFKEGQSDGFNFSSTYYKSRDFEIILEVDFIFS